MTKAEEAARDFAKFNYNDGVKRSFKDGLELGLLAGAQWQKGQDKEEIEEIIYRLRDHYNKSIDQHSAYANGVMICIIAIENLLPQPPKQSE